MKIKWLIVLFIFFLVVIILSLLITQENQKTASLFEKEIIITEQVENRVQAVYSVAVSPALITRLPLGGSGITIIKAPTIEQEEKSISVPKIADKAENIIASQNVAPSQNVALTNEAQNAPQAGITIIGKRPTPKEAQEMNSSGIVMY